jgi:CHAD domain-containing protein
MIKAMDAPDFKNALTALDDFLDTDPAAEGNVENVTPVGELARTVIYKRFRKIIRKGGRITADTPDEELHDLRIDCKKLRYLLEFFVSLFPANEMKRLIKQLKGLQENLGDFNDLSVQQEFLGDYLAGITPRTPQSIMLSAATGGLISRLAADHQRVRSEFLGVFKVFSAGENKARFKTLFN